MPMLFPLLIISLAVTVSRACRHYMSRHSQYATILPPSSFFVTSAWLKHLQLVWVQTSTHCQDVTGLQPLSSLNSWCTNPVHLCAAGTVALQPKLAANHSFTQCFVRIIRADETLFVPIPALPSIPACQVEDCDTSASSSMLPVVPWADAVEPFPLPAALGQAQTWLLAA